MGYRILFVCMGNICRSPAAECVFASRLQQTAIADAVEHDSAGTIGYHSGNPPDARMRRALKARAIPVMGAARPVSADDLERHDLILAMDRDNLANLHKLDTAGEYAKKIHLFGEFCTKTPGSDVPDPYYGGDDGFETVIDMIEDGVDNLLAYIESAIEG